MLNDEKKETPNISLSNDFQQELKNKKRKINWFGIISASSLAIIVIIVLSIGSYQIFFKKDLIKEDVNTKIQSKPAVVEEKTPTITPAPTIEPTTQEYVIADGDNLGTIAVKFDTTVEKLKTANNIQDETLLQIGQKIKIVK